MHFNKIDTKELKRTGTLQHDWPEIVFNYIKLLPKSVKRMQKALSDRDYKTLEFISHKMRGTSESLSFFNISQRAGTIEDLAKCMDQDVFDEIAQQKVAESLNELEFQIEMQQKQHTETY